MIATLLAGAAQAQPVPALRLEVTGPPVSAVSGARPGCDAPDMPDAPARAVRLATGEVQLYATNSPNRVESGADLLHLRHRCVAETDGQAFGGPPGRALVAALPHRQDQPERGRRHGGISPSNVVTLSGAQYMFAFATQARAQRPGNCLLRTVATGTPGAWRSWDGSAFGAADPHGRPVQPELLSCAPVEADRLRWPVSGLVRHAASGLFIALMQNGARGGGVYYATSPDLLHWSVPALLLPAVGPSAWSCADTAPIAFPSLLDPAAADRNFETVGVAPVLFATRFDVKNCWAAGGELVRWDVRVRLP